VTETSAVAADPLQPWPPTVEWRPVSPRQIWIEEFRLLVGTLVFVAACGVAALFVRPWLMLGAAVVAVVIAVIRAVLVVRSVRSWGYAERDEDLLVRHGLFVRRLSIVPYARMQFVDVSAGPLERLLDLATVTLHTAAAASDARIPGLRGPEAARLRDRLAALGEAGAEGL
jgi:membrane protein YdbS with pleckstrin-like domain